MSMNIKIAAIATTVAATAAPAAYFISKGRKLIGKAAIEGQREPIRVKATVGNPL